MEINHSFCATLRKFFLSRYRKDSAPIPQWGKRHPALSSNSGRRIGAVVGQQLCS